MQLVLAGIVFFLWAAGARNVVAASDQCASLNDGPFQSCTNISGYNETFVLPKKIPQSVADQMARSLQWFLKSLENCSENNVAEVMACSMFAPKCVTGSPNPVLPCRRVCGEFLKQCETTVSGFLVDYMVGICQVLPNKTASSGECLEPQDFRTNDSVRGKSCLVV